MKKLQFFISTTLLAMFVTACDKSAPTDTSAYDPAPLPASAPSPTEMQSTESSRAVASSAGDDKPTYDCGQADGSVEKLVCETPALAKLDQHLQSVYDNALQQFPDEDVKTLKTLQRGWIKGRNDCWKADDISGCVTLEYDRRITELQVKTGAFEVPAAVDFDCEDGTQLSVYFYSETNIPSAMINAGTDQFFAYQHRSGSGARYVARNETLWVKGNEASWQVMEDQTTCTVKP